MNSSRAKHHSLDKSSSPGKGRRRRSRTYSPPLVTIKHRPSILLALSWYSIPIHRGIARYAREANWVLDVSMTRSLQAPKQWNGAGIISQLYADTELCDYIAGHPCPTVNIGDVRLADIPSVHSDHAAVSRLAADYFLSRGFRHIAFGFRSNARFTSIKERGGHLKTAVEEAGGIYHAIQWEGPLPVGAPTGWNKQALIDEFGRQIALLPKPLAILAEQDEAGIELIQACLNQGIRVPEDVAVLGIGNDGLRCDFAPVPLSSMDANHELEGYTAAATLDQLLRGESPKALTLIPPKQVITRLSTDILAVNNPHVATALRCIWDNYTRPINAKTVAATVAISYRYLHDAFKKNVGRTIAEEITWKRLEKAKAMLQDTDLRAYEIANECGFATDTRMGIVFRREFNLTPLEYRARHRTKS